MKKKKAFNFFATLTLGVTLALSSSLAVSAKGQILIILLFKVSAKSPLAAMKVGPDGAFAFKDLVPGRYRVCLENMTGCVQADVGKTGSIAGTATAEINKLPGKKHNYVGHVTLLR